MIGDLKLTVLKSRLSRCGIQAEFAGEGILVCRGKMISMEDSSAPTVSVKKSTQGKIAIEGSVSDVYYTVRREVYKLHAVIAT